jgi:hypothetical protein
VSATDIIAISISVLALVVSCVTLWLAEVRRGSVVMSQPTILFFGWDQANGEDTPKIMLRCALFSSAARGAVLENLYLLIDYDKHKWPFPFWGYDEGEGMVRGSGLYIGREGHVAYHHFNPISVEDDFGYGPGPYSVEVWGKRFGDKAPLLLGRYTLNLEAKDMALALAERSAGVLWTWDPLGLSYYPEASNRPRFEPRAAIG